MKQDNKNIAYMVAIIALLVFLPGTEESAVPYKSIDGEWDISAQVESNQLQQYLIEVHDFDYSNPEIQALASQIKGSTGNSFEAIKETARYVVTNIDYSSKISIGYCYDETASSVLSAGIGDCVSMSRLVTALLRAQGVPARTVGGCLASFRGCDSIFAAVPSLNARVTQMELGDFKKRGFLHEWVEAWDPVRGWLLIEATSGQVFSTSCQTYIQYSYDSNRYDRCVITDNGFWNLCRGS